jgi:Transposase IS200 like
VSSHSHEMNFTDGRLREPKTHDIDLQISRGLHSEMSAQGVSQVVGYIKGKSAIHLARVYGERKRNFVGQHFWARGFLREHGRPGRGRHPAY